MAKKFSGFIALWALLITTLFFASVPAFSQYYYKDLITTQEVNRTYLLYKNNKVASIKLNSFQGDRPVTEGFICEQKVAKNQVVTYTKTADAGESFVTASYNARALLVKTIDSSEEVVSTTQYTYDGSDRVVQISNETHARDQSSRTTEVHAWQYNDAGKPVKMYRVRNGNDSTVVSFAADEKNNVSEEHGGKGASSETIYYYYDDKNRLTDIVRYNNKAHRLLPDYVFEYDESGDLSTMLIVPEGTSEYLKWYYKYDENGLKAVEFCYNKRKELQGKIEYSYNTANTR